jgi:hypothetical protein
MLARVDARAVPRMPRQTPSLRRLQITAQLFWALFESAWPCSQDPPRQKELVFLAFYWGPSAEVRDVLIQGQAFLSRKRRSQFEKSVPLLANGQNS